jgi:hypothetical protein
MLVLYCAWTQDIGIMTTREPLSNGSISEVLSFLRYKASASRPLNISIINTANLSAEKVVRVVRLHDVSSGSICVGLENGEDFYLRPKRMLRAWDDSERVLIQEVRYISWVTYKATKLQNTCCYL